MDELFDLEEELVLFFANYVDSFHNIGLIYHHSFFEKLSKTGFDVSGHNSLDIWEAVKSLKLKGYVDKDVDHKTYEKIIFDEIESYVISNAKNLVWSEFEEDVYNKYKSLNEK